MGVAYIGQAAIHYDGDGEPSRPASPTETEQPSVGGRREEEAKRLALADNEDGMELYRKRRKSRKPPP